MYTNERFTISGSFKYASLSQTRTSILYTPRQTTAHNYKTTAARSSKVQLMTGKCQNTKTSFKSSSGILDSRSK